MRIIEFCENTRNKLVYHRKNVRNKDDHKSDVKELCVHMHIWLFGRVKFKLEVF